MDKITLRTLCEKTGVSRRAIQGYESHGLVSHIDKNNRGYLLYDGGICKTVSEIRLLQDFGLSLSEICDYMNTSIDAKIRIMEAKEVELTEKCSELKEYLKELRIQIKTSEV